LFLFRWLGRPPEDFLTGPRTSTGGTRLPAAGLEHRLRWDLGELHAGLNAERQRRGLTWAQLAAALGCTPSRLTGLRTATFADLELTMRVTQWLGRPAADFIHAVPW
jgi:hypothetical protein